MYGELDDMIGLEAALGLFSDKIVNKETTIGTAPSVLARNVQPEIPAASVNYPVSYLLTSMFALYFALFKSSNFRINYGLLLLRVLTLLIYIPVLCYFNAAVDASVIFACVFGRLCYVSYWAIRYRSWAFILLNTDRVAFVNGKSWYGDDLPYTILSGGDRHVCFGHHVIPFVNANELYIALRGRKEEDIPLSRSIELLNGVYLYVFAPEPCVGVVNLAFKEIPLYEKPSDVCATV
nr:NS3 protein [Megaderma bat coronavirus]URD31308.1 NS3 protein [Megaderma bat coronavirus]